MPCSTSSTLRVTAVRPLGEQPLLQVGELVAQLGERLLAVRLAAVEARGGVGGRSRPGRRGRAAGGAGRMAGASWRAASAQHGRVRRACSRRPCRRAVRLGLVEPEPLGEPEPWPASAASRGCGGRAPRSTSSRRGTGARACIHAQTHPGAEAAAGPRRRRRWRSRRRRGRVRRRARRSRGSRRSGSPGTNPTERPLTSAHPHPGRRRRRRSRGPYCARRPPRASASPVGPTTARRARRPPAGARRAGRRGVIDRSVTAARSGRRRTA